MKNFKLDLTNIIRIVAIVLAIPPIVYACTRLPIGLEPEYPWAVAFLALGVVIEALQFFFDGKIMKEVLSISGALILTVGTAFFVIGGVLNFSDFVAGVGFWGDASQGPAVIAFSIISICSTACGLVNCYITKS